MPFEESADFLKKLLDMEVSNKTIQILVENIGKQIAEDELMKIFDRINEDGYVKDFQESTEKIKDIAYMELDGCMVNTIEENWKEVRNGIIYKESDIAQIDKNHKEILEKKYFSVFNYDENSLQKFKNRATQEAYDFGFQSYENAVILGDGAQWIWDYAELYHPYATQILDFYHACEYLGDAFKSINFKKEKTKPKRKKILFDWLEDGEINKIISYLRKQTETEAIKNCIRYFKKNKKRMKYKEYRDKGFHIGSGSIESAHKILVQSRMKQAGMHWSKENVQSIVAIRALYLSNQWDTVVEYLKVA